MRQLVIAVRWELHKQGKIAARADFGPYAELVEELSEEAGEGAAPVIEVRRSRDVRRR